MDDCIEWPGYRERWGYGTITRKGKTYLAHRWTWAEAHGPIPEGMCVLHRCDNPPCINVAHLWLGTPADNARDRDTKGRGGAARGTAHGQAKLTEDRVRSIRDRYAAGGVTQKELAQEFGVCIANISMIVRRVSWKGCQ